MSVIRYSLLLAAFFCNFAYAQPTEPSRELNDPAHSVVINHATPDFQLRLSSNPTTGYGWYLKKYDRQLFRVVRTHYEHPQSTLLGAGGVSVWSFRAVPEAFKVPHVSEIVLVYMRAEDIKSADEKTFTIVTSSCVPATKKHTLHHFTCE